ncbi:hypothetical protein LINPERPRIM_LOCUS29150 [Linum perenne]
MLQLVENKEVESGNFQNGGFKKIEALMKILVPGCTMKVTPHIKSRHRIFKNKYIAITEVKNGGASGFGWDESKHQIVADDDVLQAWAKRFPGAKGLNKKPFSYYDQLARIFGKDRAGGGGGGGGKLNPQQIFKGLLLLLEMLKMLLLMAMLKVLLLLMAMLKMLLLLPLNHLLMLLLHLMMKPPRGCWRA